MSNTTDFNARSYKYAWKWVGLSWLFAATLWGSWHWDVTHAIWDQVDKSVYLTLHSTLEYIPSSKHFWAHVNSRIGDWVLEGVIFLIAFYELIRGRKGRFCWLWIGFVVIFATHLLWHNVKDLLALDWPRLSPSYVLGVKVDLSQWTKWPNCKVWSQHSFPGDHALTLWIILFWFYHVARAYLVPVGLLVLIAALPRLIAGAHWFSDVMVGALSLSLIAAPLGFKVLLSLRQCGCGKASVTKGR